MLSNTIRMSLYKGIAVKNRRIKIVESRRIKNVENTPYYSHSITNALRYYSHIYPCKGIAVKNRRVKNVESGPIFHMGLLCTEHHRCSSVQFTSLFACLSIRVSQWRIGASNMCLFYNLTHIWCAYSIFDTYLMRQICAHIWRIGAWKNMCTYSAHQICVKYRIGLFYIWHIFDAPRIGASNMWRIGLFSA